MMSVREHCVQVCLISQNCHIHSFSQRSLHPLPHSILHSASTVLLQWRKDEKQTASLKTFIKSSSARRECRFLDALWLCELLANSLLYSGESLSLMALPLFSPSALSLVSLSLCTLPLLSHFLYTHCSLSLLSRSLSLLPHSLPLLSLFPSTLTLSSLSHCSLSPLSLSIHHQTHYTESIWIGECKWKRQVKEKRVMVPSDSFKNCIWNLIA